MNYTSSLLANADSLGLKAWDSMSGNVGVGDGVVHAVVDGSQEGSYSQRRDVGNSQ
jgi:hypothetical protein